MSTSTTRRLFLKTLAAFGGLATCAGTGLRAALVRPAGKKVSLSPPPVEKPEVWAMTTASRHPMSSCVSRLHLYLPNCSLSILTTRPQVKEMIGLLRGEHTNTVHLGDETSGRAICANAGIFRCDQIVIGTSCRAVGNWEGFSFYLSSAEARCLADQLQSLAEDDDCWWE